MTEIMPGVTRATVTPDPTPYSEPELEPTAAVPAAPPVPRLARPGYCSEHPGAPLVEPKRFPGWSRYDDRVVAVLCPDAEHTALDRERCAYCGRELHRLAAAGAWRYGSRRTTCSATCRNYLFRWLAMQRPPRDPERSVAR